MPLARVNITVIAQTLAQGVVWSVYHKEASTWWWREDTECCPTAPISIRAGWVSVSVKMDDILQTVWWQFGDTVGFCHSVPDPQTHSAVVLLPLLDLDLSTALAIHRLLSLRTHLTHSLYRPLWKKRREIALKWIASCCLRMLIKISSSDPYQWQSRYVGILTAREE